MQHELDIDQASNAELSRDGVRDAGDALFHFGFDDLDRVDADRIAGVNASALDVLEDARNQHVLAVENGVDLELEPAQIPVDQQWCFWQYRRRGFRVRGQLRLVINDLHRATTQDERGTDEHRKAELASDGSRLTEAASGLSLRSRDA